MLPSPNRIARSKKLDESNIRWFRQDNSGLGTDSTKPAVKFLVLIFATGILFIADVL